MPGLESASLAMDTEEGVEVVWNEVQFSDKKVFKSHEVFIRPLAFFILKTNSCITPPFYHQSTMECVCGFVYWVECAFKKIFGYSTRSPKPNVLFKIDLTLKCMPNIFLLCVCVRASG